MDRASLPDLDSLDRRLEAELESHRQIVSQQSEELRSRSERIEHMKLMIEKLRHRMFGAKSENIVEQLEFRLEEFLIAICNEGMEHVQLCKEQGHQEAVTALRI